MSRHKKVCTMSWHSTDSLLPVFLKPLFPIYPSCDDHAGDIVTDGVYHCGGRVDERSDHREDRQGFEREAVEGQLSVPVVKVPKMPE